MTIEFMSEPLSSDIHWGPHVPIAPMSKQVQFWLNFVKTSLFSISLLVQLVLYLGVVSGRIAMPQNIDDDSEALSELANIERLCGCGRLRDTSLPMENSPIGHPNNHQLYETDTGSSFENIALHPNNTNTNSSSHSSNNNRSRNISPNPKDSGNDHAHSVISIAYFENFYIALWVGKDVFWSMGTGDWESVRETRLVLTLESIGLILGFFTLLTCLLTAYVYRRNTVTLLDSITVLLWVAANFVWMSGEFFIRFHNMEFDDSNEGNDRDTRIISTILFTSGIMIQFGVIAYLSAVKPRQHRHELASVSPVERMTTSDSQRGGITSGMLSAYRPQKYSQLEITDGVEDEVPF